MHIDHLIVGQGICGTFLSWYLRRSGRSFVIIDDARPDTASRIAAGIINPVTGRRIVKTWMIDEVMPFAIDAYRLLGEELNINPIEQRNIIDFFPTPQMKIAFHQRYAENTEYLSIPHEQTKWNEYFNNDFGFGEISPCWLVNVADILLSYRSVLGNQLKEEVFNFELLGFQDGHFLYKDLAAKSIIFCEGAAGTMNPYFERLPFASNKGEVLWIECKGLPRTHIYKSGLNVVPWKDDIFWIGSTYQWEYENVLPSVSFRERTVANLRRWLKLPFTVIDHKASIRPATLERRPFAGFHPIYKNIGIFNGMGTKGCSLAPFFARQMVANIVEGTPIQADVDIARFKNILTKNI